MRWGGDGRHLQNASVHTDSQKCDNNKQTRPVVRSGLSWLAQEEEATVGESWFARTRVAVEWTPPDPTDSFCGAAWGCWLTSWGLQLGIPVGTRRKKKSRLISSAEIEGFSTTSYSFDDFTPLHTSLCCGGTRPGKVPSCPCPHLLLHHQRLGSCKISPARATISLPL